METIQFGRWRVNCDPQQTQEAHARITVGSPEACGCLDCTNFAEARDRIYPVEMTDLLRRLGINPRHEAEVYCMGREEAGLHLYGGWFHCVGSVESEGDAVGQFDIEKDKEPFTIFFTDKAQVVDDAFKGIPVAQIEFVARVPWVLGQPESH